MDALSLAGDAGILSLARADARFRRLIPSRRLHIAIFGLCLLNHSNITHTRPLERTHPSPYRATTTAVEHTEYSERGRPTRPHNIRMNDTRLKTRQGARRKSIHVRPSSSSACPRGRQWSASDGGGMGGAHSCGWRAAVRQVVGPCGAKGATFIMIGATASERRCMHPRRVCGGDAYTARGRVHGSGHSSHCIRNTI